MRTAAEKNFPKNPFFRGGFSENPGLVEQRTKLVDLLYGATTSYQPIRRCNDET